MKSVIILPLFLLFVIQGYSQVPKDIDTLFMSDSVCNCNNGLVLAPGNLPNPSLGKYKCFLSEYNNIAVVIRKKKKFAEIEVYKKETLICPGYHLFSWDKLPLTLKLSYKEYSKGVFLDDILLEDKKEVVVIYK